MSPRTATRPRRLGDTGVTILESLAQHRLLTTRQVHELHTPDASIRWTQDLLGRLRHNGFALPTTLPGRRFAWHLTAAGADSLKEVSSRAEERRYVVTPEKAAGPLQAHTLGVNDIGIAFVRAARARDGDECTPFNWFHEIAYSLGPPPGRRMPEQLIADARLDYLQVTAKGGFRISYVFVELDRANRSVDDLARRMGRYARLYRRKVPVESPGYGTTTVWGRQSPVFPGVLLVLDGGSEAKLRRRRGAVLASCRADGWPMRTPQVLLFVCLLDDLLEEGLFAPIFRTTDDPHSDVGFLDEERP